MARMTPIKRFSSGTISGRGAWATIFLLMCGAFPLAFAAAIPLAIACKALLYEKNRIVQVLVLLNVFLSGWLAVWATMCVEVRPSPWLSERWNAELAGFYATLLLFGPVLTALAWMNVLLLPSTAAYIVLGMQRSRRCTTRN